MDQQQQQPDDPYSDYPHPQKVPHEQQRGQETKMRDVEEEEEDSMKSGGQKSPPLSPSGPNLVEGDIATDMEEVRVYIRVLYTSRYVREFSRVRLYRELSRYLRLSIQLGTAERA